MMKSSFKNIKRIAGFVQEIFKLVSSFKEKKATGILMIVTVPKDENGPDTEENMDFSIGGAGSTIALAKAIENQEMVDPSFAVFMNDIYRHLKAERLKRSANFSKN